MTDLFYEEYDGEMLFDISDVEMGDSEYSFIIKSNYAGKTIGVKVTIPVMTGRTLFKKFTIIKPNSQLVFSSIGEQSDGFVCALEELLKPSYISSKKFTDEPEGIDFSVSNREMYNLSTDKIYLKLFNGEDQSELDEDEKINLEMNFSFNLQSKRASLVEVREGYSADLIAIIMK